MLEEHLEELGVFLLEKRRQRGTGDQLQGPEGLSWVRTNSLQLWVLIIQT